MESKSSAGLKMKHADIILGVCFFLLGLGIFFVCKRDDLMFYHNKTPGPGFMPLIAGTIIAGCGIAIAVKAFLRLSGRINDPCADEPVATRDEWYCVLVITAIGAATVFLAQYLGLATAITLAMIFMIRLLGPEPWKTSIIVGICAGVVIYVSFGVLLGVPVPTGPFGF